MFLKPQTTYDSARNLYIEDAETPHQLAWWARLSAPGYLDCTDWIGPFESEIDAIKSLWQDYGNNEINEEFSGIDEYLGCISEYFPSFESFWNGYILALGFTASSLEDGLPLFRCLRQDFSDSFKVGDILAYIDHAKQLELMSDCVSFYVDHIESIDGFEERSGALFHYARNRHGVTWISDCSWVDEWRMRRKLQDDSHTYGTAELCEHGIHN